MDVNDLKGLYAESTKRMNTALEHVKHELGGVRTGRATVTQPLRHHCGLVRGREDARDLDRAGARSGAGPQLLDGHR